MDDGRLPAQVRRCEIGELAHGCDLVLALGGDGTMLGGLRLAAPLGVPVLGANLGRLGYLTEVDGEHLPDALEALGAGAYGVEERFVLRAAWKEDGQEREHVAFNDVVLSRVPGAARPCWRSTSTASSWSVTPATASSPPLRSARPPTATRPAARSSRPRRAR